MLVLLAGEARHDARVLRHLRCFSEAGLAVTLLSCDATSPWPEEPAVQHVRWPGYGRAKSQARTWKASKGQAFYGLKLASIACFNYLAWRRLRQHRFDLYLANDFDTLPAAQRLAAAAGGRLIYDSHELFAEQRPDAPQAYIWAVRRWEGRLIRQADQVVTVNPSLARELQQRHRLAAAPEVILNVPAPAALPPPPRLPRSVLFHGNLMPGRGLVALVTAVARIPGLRLRLRGQGVLQTSLQELARQLGAQERIEFEPAVPVACIIQEAARFEIGVVFLEPDCLNNHLGLPNKVFEYMHAGLAVLTNNAPELQRLVDEHAIGLSVTSLQPEAIEAALRRLLDDSAGRQRFQDNALWVAQSTYHFGVEQRKWLHIVQRLGAV